jgi:hypothetical protein
MMFRGALAQIRRQPVAFVALFFALGGSALAGTKYLTASDSISQGDLAGSTYGHPVIAPGAVGNGKLQNPSLTVSPGTGLTGGGSIPLGGSGTLSFDPAVVQGRVSGTCSGNTAIQAVNQDGTVACSGDLGPSAGFEGDGTPGVRLTNNPALTTTVASKDVPAGSYVINAETELDNSNTSTDIHVTCQLLADGGGIGSEGSIDDVHLAPANSPGDIQTIPLEAEVTGGGPGTLSLVCSATGGSNGDVFSERSELTAIKVGSIQ